MSSLKLVSNTLAAAIHAFWAAIALAPKLELNAAVNVGVIVSAALERGATTIAAATRAEPARAAVVLRRNLNRLAKLLFIIPHPDEAGRDATPTGSRAQHLSAREIEAGRSEGIEWPATGAAQFQKCLATFHDERHSCRRSSHRRTQWPSVDVHLGSSFSS